MKRRLTMNRSLWVALPAALTVAVCGAWAWQAQVGPRSGQGNGACRKTAACEARCPKGADFRCVATIDPGDQDEGATFPLSDAELNSMRYMREEEKLARDVYLALYEQFDDPVFLIHNAEQRHMNAMNRLITRYGIDDPVVDDEPGTFTDEAIASLYEEYLAKGLESLTGALQIGVKIEELDISDLNDAIESTDREDLSFVYGNLQRASRNHLRAYYSRLAATGATYAPEHLTQEAFDAIVSSPYEPGPGHRGGRGRGQQAGQLQEEATMGTGGTGNRGAGRRGMQQRQRHGQNENGGNGRGPAHRQMQQDQNSDQ